MDLAVRYAQHNEHLKSGILSLVNEERTVKQENPKPYQMFLPPRPVQRVIRVIARLWYQHDMRILSLRMLKLSEINSHPFPRFPVLYQFSKSSSGRVVSEQSCSGDMREVMIVQNP